MCWNFEISLLTGIFSWRSAYLLLQKPQPQKIKLVHRKENYKQAGRRSPKGHKLIVQQSLGQEGTHGFKESIK